MRYMLLAVLAVVLTTSGVLRAQDDAKVVSSGISMVGGDLETIDPGLAEASSQIEVINQIFVGLTAQDVVTAESGLGLASSYEVSEDGKTFTFKLMDNVPWVRYNAETGAVEEVTEGTDAIGQVTVTMRAGGVLASGQGASTDVLEASASAYVRALSNAMSGAAVREAEAATADAAEVRITGP